MFSGAIPQSKIAQTDLTFEDLDLQTPILDALDELGFIHPTPIQVEVIPPALKGYDLIGLAQTGSGKTAAFGLPMADYLQSGSGLGGLVVCPTREIALQSQAFFQALTDRGVDIRSVCVIGGAPMRPQIQGLRKNPDVVVATPGRLLDHLERRNLHFRDLEVLVIDEGDHMLDLGFLPQIVRIFEAVPEDRQTMMFSATMPAAIERLAQRFMRDPLVFNLLPKGRTAEGIEHRLYLVEPEDKKPCLISIANQEEGSMLVFVRRKVDADWICRQLEIEGHPVERMHSDLSQRHRVDALQGLREGDHRILVATDIAARGIDIPIIQHIVNFNIPETVEDYIHRAGRTARGDAGGVVSSVASWDDKTMIQRIEDALGQKIPRCVAPGVQAWKERNVRKTIKGRERIRRRLL